MGIKTNSYKEIIINKNFWKEYYNIDIGEEPELPLELFKILQESCPFWGHYKNKKSGEFLRVSDTHLLVLIPKTVNGKPLTLKLLDELIRNPIKGKKTELHGPALEKA